MKIDQVMIQSMLGSEAVGQYSAAVRISEAWYFIPMVITSSLLPAIINAKKKSEKLYYARLQRLYDLMVWISLAVAVPMTFLSNWVINLLYGSAYNQAGGVLMIHIWAGLFVSLSVAQGKFWLINNLLNKQLIITISCSLINILLNLLLIKQYNIKGAALATLISYAVGCLFLPLFFKEARIMIKMSYKSLFIGKFFYG